MLPLIPAVLLVAACSSGGAALQSGKEAVSQSPVSQSPVSDQAQSQHGVQAHSTAATKANGDGSEISVEGLTLELVPMRYQAPLKHDFAFRIVGKDGNPVKDYTLNHEHPLHLFFMSADCTFLHLHPQLQDDGTWLVKDHSFPHGSVWAMVTEFEVAKPSEVSNASTGAFQLGTLVKVDGDGPPTELDWTPTTVDEVDGYTVTLDGNARLGPESPFKATITRNDGAPVILEEHMGAGGHFVAFKTAADELAETDGRHFVHTHHIGEGVPSDGSPLEFLPDFPASGSYRLVIQFKTEDKVREAEFFIYVSENGETYQPNDPSIASGSDT